MAPCELLSSCLRILVIFGKFMKKANALLVGDLLDRKLTRVAGEEISANFV